MTRIDPFGGQMATEEAEDGRVVGTGDGLPFCGLDGLREGTALTEEAEGLDDGGIVLIEIFGPSLLVEDVVDDAAVDKALQQLLRLLDHQVTALETVLVGKDDKLLQRVLALEEPLHLVHIVHLAQTGPVLVGVVVGELQDESRHRGLLVV